MATHQGPTQVALQLATYGDMISDQIIKHFKKPIVLCYTGMSGTALASSLLLSLHAKKFKHPVGMLFVRKEDEPSNSGRKLHWNDAYHEDAAYIFVDDQVGSGKSFKRVENGLLGAVPQMIPYDYGMTTVQAEKRIEEVKKRVFLSYVCLKMHGLQKIVKAADSREYGFTDQTPGRKLEPIPGVTSKSACFKY